MNGFGFLSLENGIYCDTMSPDCRVLRKLEHMGGCSKENDFRSSSCNRH